MRAHIDDIPLDVVCVVELDKCFASSRVLSMDDDCGAPEKEKGAVGFVGPASLKCGERVLRALVLGLRSVRRLMRLRGAIAERFIQMYTTV